MKNVSDKFLLFRSCRLGGQPHAAEFSTACQPSSTHLPEMQPRCPDHRKAHGSSLCFFTQCMSALCAKNHCIKLYFGKAIPTSHFRLEPKTKLHIIICCHVHHHAPVLSLVFMILKKHTENFDCMMHDMHGSTRHAKLQLSCLDMQKTSEHSNTLSKT